APFHYTVKEAKQRGMKVWLYDEGGWPSGQAGGLIVRQHPELKGKVLFKEGNEYTIREWGRTDLLNPRATELFLKLVHEKYKEYVGDEFGKTIPGIFTDEPKVHGLVASDSIPWTDNIEQIFEKDKGYKLKAYLPMLFNSYPLTSSNYAEVIKIRIDFSDVWISLFAKSYFGKIHHWCQANNLIFEGHFSGEDSISNHRKFLGHYFKLARHLDIPGIDVIWRQIFPGQINKNFPKFASSAANLSKKRYSLSESYAVYGWGLTFAEMKWILNYQLVRGINKFGLMAFNYSTDGSGRISTQSHMFFKNPKWPYFKYFSEYVANSCKIMSQGKPEIKIGLYYPIESLWIGNKRDKEVEHNLEKISNILLSQHYDFNYIDDEAIKKAVINRGKLKIGYLSLDAIIVPEAKVFKKAIY
ncbi:unnamed protein product, partial [marine sediment metagenome]